MYRYSNGPDQLGGFQTAGGHESEGKQSTNHDETEPLFILTKRRAWIWLRKNQVVSFWKVLKNV